MLFYSRYIDGTSTTNHQLWRCLMKMCPNQFSDRSRCSCGDGTSKVSPEQRTRVQMSPEAQNDIKMHFYDFYQINLYVFNKFQIYFINYSGF